MGGGKGGETCDHIGGTNEGGEICPWENRLANRKKIKEWIGPKVREGIRKGKGKRISVNPSSDQFWKVQADGAVAKRSKRRKPFI